MLPHDEGNTFFNRNDPFPVITGAPMESKGEKRGLLLFVGNEDIATIICQYQ